MGQGFGAGEHAGEADNGGGRRFAAQAHIKRHHGALAEADQREPIAGELEAGEFRIEEGVELGRRGLGAAQGFLRIHARERKPLIAGAGNAFGRVGRDEGGAGEAPSANAAQDR